MSTISGINLENEKYNITLPFLASGFTTTAGSSTSGAYLAAKWAVADVNGITTPVNGMTIAVRVPLAGNSGGVLLSIDGGTTYYPIVRNVSTLVTTNYAVGSTIILTFNSTQTAKPYLTAGTTTTVTGCWQIADYDGDTKVTQTVRTTNGEFPILLRGTSAGTSTTTTTTTFGTGVTVNPSTKTITADNITANKTFNLGRKSGSTSGNPSVALGGEITASGQYSVGEGYGVFATGMGSHAEGNATTASDNYSHAEGFKTTASAQAAHAEGASTVASGDNAHAEGAGSVASKQGSHAEGYQTQANGDYSHVEGGESFAEGAYSHAEGIETVAFGEGSHAEGFGEALGTIIITGVANALTYTYSGATPEVGQVLIYNGKYTTIYDVQTSTSQLSTLNTLSSSALSGVSVTLMGGGALGNSSHVEGYRTTAAEVYSHAEGRKSRAFGMASHAEGYGTRAISNYSHAEGSFTKTSGSDAHAEGTGTTASGSASHAEGWQTQASGAVSHAEGMYIKASSDYQHVQGKYNIEDADEVYAHIVGNGTDDSVRSNAHTLDWDGNAWFAGDVYVGGTNQTTGSSKLTPIFIVPFSGSISNDDVSTDVTFDQIYTTLFDKSKLVVGRLNNEYFTVGQYTANTIYFFRATNTNVYRININYNNVVSSSSTSMARLDSPTFTGTPKAPTAAAGTNTTQIATTAFVTTAVSGKANSSHNQAASTITAGTLGGKVLANATAAATLTDAQVRNIKASTTDLTAGTSSLTTGDIYVVYE